MKIMENGKIEFVTASYDGKKIEVNKTPISISKIEDGVIHINPSEAKVNFGRIQIADTNKPKLMKQGTLPVYIEFCAYSKSDFETRMLIRQVIVNEMEEQRIAIMQFIAKFDDIFINTDT